MSKIKKLIIALSFLNSFLLFADPNTTMDKSKVNDSAIRNINLNLKRNYEFELNVSFSNINIGKLKYSIDKNNMTIFSKTTLETNSFYDFIFKIRDELNSVFDIKKRRSSEFNFNKREGRKESFVKMVFDDNKIHFSEKWKKKNKSGKKEKIYHPEGKDYFDILTMLNRAIFSECKFDKGDYFWLALKSNFYKILLKEKKIITVKYKKKKVKAFKYKFSSFKGSKEEKKGDFSIVVIQGETPVFYELQGYLKIGKIKGISKYAR